MSVSFNITYSWKKQSTPSRFEAEDYADVTALVLCLERFLAIYMGQFVARLNDLDMHFDLRPDLSTIFEELPDVLEALTSDTTAPVELYFFEQGTDLTFWLERHANAISIRLAKGQSVGKRFADLPEATFSVPANVFLDEWIRFAQAVLDALLALQPDLANDESYQEYRDRLLSLQSAR